MVDRKRAPEAKSSKSARSIRPSTRAPKVPPQPGVDTVPPTTARSPGRISQTPPTPRAGPSPDDIVSGGRVHVVYQPVVDLRTRKVFAYEALVRSKAREYPDAKSILDAAVESRSCGRLGRHLRSLAVDGCPFAPLFLNIHPRELEDQWLVRPDDPIFQHEHTVFLEIGEAVPVTHESYCASVLAEIRHRGIGLVVDDLGEGASNLKAIADLGPDVVKIARTLIAGATRRSRQFVLLRGLVRLCEELGARVVIEGVESDDELVLARDAGAHFAQGYRLAHPGNPPPVVDPVALQILSG